MTQKNDEITKALSQLKRENRHLTSQQYKTLRGKILAGDIPGAMKGLQKILNTRGKA